MEEKYLGLSGETYRLVYLMFSSILFPSILLKFKCFKFQEEGEKSFLQWGPILILPV